MSNLTDKIDSDAAAFISLITPLQESFLAAHGMYFQGLHHSSSVLADGATATPDDWDTTPSYQNVTWRQFCGNPPALSNRMRIDQYHGPSGHGWLLTLKVIQAGVEWERVINIGPETRWDSGGWVITKLESN